MVSIQLSHSTVWARGDFPVAHLSTQSAISFFVFKIFIQNFPFDPIKVKTKIYPERNLEIRCLSGQFRVGHLLAHSPEQFSPVQENLKLLHQIFFWLDKNLGSKWTHFSISWQNLEEKCRLEGEIKKWEHWVRHYCLRNCPAWPESGSTATCRQSIRHYV